MGFSIREVGGRRDLRRFIRLPERLHRGHATWVPPLYREEWRYFNPERNRAFSSCDTLLLLALEGSEPVGRVMGIIHHRHNALRGHRTARFAYLESREDPELVGALLGRVEDWARRRGMNRIVGPFGFSDQDPEGFLIEGFEHRATVVTYHNFPWMPVLVEAHGYGKEVDYVVYRLEVPREIPARWTAVMERIRRRGNFEIVEARSRREVRPWIRPAFRLMNETFSSAEIYGFAPLDEADMEDLARRFMSIVDPRFLKGVRKGDELVAFMIGIPDMTRGIQRARGRLFPLGWFHILRAARRTRQLDLLLGGIKAPYRGMGLDVLMALKMRISAQEAGFQVVDSHHELESNTAVRVLMEKWGGKVYKRFRVYQKPL
jgi:hypothetical protein